MSILNHSVSWFLLPFLFFLFWKGSLFKSNSVCLSMWWLQSPALWSGLSILSPTSCLFKRAKAQQCSFLNTQIHKHQERDHCLAKEAPPHAFSPSSSSSLSLSSHLGLRLSTSHYPPSSIGLITPRLVLLLPPTAPSLPHNLSFNVALLLLFTPLPLSLFTFLHLPWWL